MAAQVGRFNGENDPSDSIERNMIGTANIVRACTDHHTRLLNFSTSEVFGHNSVFGTPDIMEQNGVYGLTKLAAEGIVKHYVDTYGLVAFSVRPFMVYGPHESPNGVFRSAISNFLDAAMNGVEIQAHEGCVRSWCFAEDFCRGIMLLLDHAPSSYESICIGTDEYRSMEEAARVVIGVVGRGSYAVTPVPQSLVSAVKKADFARIRELGFDPKVGLEEGVARTYEWMCAR
jgi:nucleoside-diphosphate-sugar epimerase